VLNTTLVHDGAGREAGRYDKIHLFGLNRGEDRFDESATIQAGRTPVVCDVDHPGRPRLRVGLSICYDLRFPELYRRMAPVDLIVVPSAFTYQTGEAHWEILLRARAIENQCYVLAAAQGGRHPNGRRTWGHSMLVDPWGDIVACLPDGEGMVTGEVDPARIAEVRRSLPALTHRVL
jgi:predicted amidohydrolase